MRWHAQARAGLIRELTGIDDPCEVPATPELKIDTSDQTPDIAANQIIVKLESLGYLK